MRTDARRNLERIVLAARDLVVEQGPSVALEEIARTAGVGIGTLYRRFPDREALLKTVALQALDDTTTTARQARAKEDDPLDALARYLREALELRVSAVIPAVLDVLDLTDEDLQPARDASAHAVQALVDDAHASGQLAGGITFTDIGTMLVRIARPLPGPMAPNLKHELARRHLEIFIRCLGSEGASDCEELPGPALSLSDLRDITERT